MRDWRFVPARREDLPAQLLAERFPHLTSLELFEHVTWSAYAEAFELVSQLPKLRLLTLQCWGAALDDPSAQLLSQHPTLQTVTLHFSPAAPATHSVNLSADVLEAIATSRSWQTLVLVGFSGIDRLRWELSKIPQRIKARAVLTQLLQPTRFRLEVWDSGMHERTVLPLWQP